MFNYIVQCEDCNKQVRIARTIRKGDHFFHTLTCGYTKSYTLLSQRKGMKYPFPIECLLFCPDCQEAKEQLKITDIPDDWHDITEVPRCVMCTAVIIENHVQLQSLPNQTHKDWCTACLAFEADYRPYTITLHDAANLGDICLAQRLLFLQREKRLIDCISQNGLTAD